MTPDRIVRVLVAVLLLGLGVWIARNTYWDQVTVRDPPQGEAARNPFYGLQRVAASLGIRSQFVATLSPLPPHPGVLMLSDAAHDLLDTPIESVERWVNGGGRLIISAAALRASKPFESWSGISTERPKEAKAHPLTRRATTNPGEDCETLSVQAAGTPTGPKRSFCGIYLEYGMTSRRTPVWTAVSETHGPQALRVDIGRGSVTATPLGPFIGNQAILLGDHAQLLLEAADLRRGDRLYILYPLKAESLGALLWRLMAPAIVFLLAAAILIVIRHLPRFGPRIPEAPAVRRSLAEQLRANAAFAWRTRKLGSLRKAVRRGLDEAAARRIPAYSTMSSRQRAVAIAGVTAAEIEPLLAAMTRDAAAGIRTQRAAIAILEHARRALKVPSPEHKGNS